jgi:hypothetical protein
VKSMLLIRACIDDSDDAHDNHPALSRYQHILYERGRYQDLTALHSQKQESVPIFGEMEDSNGTVQHWQRQS